MRRTILALTIAAACPAAAQDDLLSLLGEDSTEVEYTTASFKATRVINGNSIENTAHGVLDFRISHRFGFLSSGSEEFWGLDQAFIRLGLDYGVTPRLMVGVGRSSYQKTYDGFVKYKLLRQCDAGCTMPLTLAFVAATSINGIPQSTLWPYPEEERPFYFSHRMAYSFQLIAGRKFSESISFQLNPGLVHINLVEKADQTNDIFHLSGAGRVKLSKRVAINAEYFYVLPGQIPEPTAADLAAGELPVRNSFSIGFDIETGGHVFQLHMTNSLAMFERGYITETTEQWSDGGIHFGFNISRVFTLHDPKPKR